MTGNRKAVGLLVIVCLTGLIAVSPAKPQSTGTIYINADGSFSDPSKIQRSGNVYSLTGDLYGSAIVVECNHIVLDGRGFKLESGTNAWVSGSVAINLTCSDVTVKGFKIVGFWEVGILGNYGGNEIVDNDITKTDRAVSIYADDYVVKGNYLADNDVGVRVKGNCCIIFQNQIVNNDASGIRLTDSTNTAIVANKIQANLNAISTDNRSFQMYHNNFIDQTVGSEEEGWQAMVLIYSANETLPPWDDGFPSGGNYWSNYADLYPNATEIDSSGIGDTAYSVLNKIAVGAEIVDHVAAVDRYPLLSQVDIQSEPMPSLPPTTSVSPSPSVTPSPTTPVPSPSPTPEQTASSPEPTTETSPSPAAPTNQPIQTPDQQTVFPPEYVLGLALVVVAAVLIAATLAARKRHV